MFLVVLDWSVLHITVSLLRLYFDLCLFSSLFTLIVVFVIYCFVLPMWRIKIYICKVIFCGTHRASLFNKFEIMSSSSVVS